MYVTDSMACKHRNSQTPIDPAEIVAQVRRVNVRGRRFVEGNQQLENLVVTLGGSGIGLNPGGAASPAQFVNSPSCSSPVFPGGGSYARLSPGRSKMFTAAGPMGGPFRSDVPAFFDGPAGRFLDGPAESFFDDAVSSAENLFESLFGGFFGAGGRRSVPVSSTKNGSSLPLGNAAVSGGLLPPSQSAGASPSANTSGPSSGGRYICTSPPVLPAQTIFPIPLVPPAPVPVRPPVGPLPPVVGPPAPAPVDPEMCREVNGGNICRLLRDGCVSQNQTTMEQVYLCSAAGWAGNRNLYPEVLARGGAQNGKYFGLLNGAPDPPTGADVAAVGMSGLDLSSGGASLLCFGLAAFAAVMVFGGRR